MFPLEKLPYFRAVNLKFESAKNFTKLGKLGAGSFGSVFVVQSKKDGQKFAFKKLLMKTDACSELHSTSRREIEYLQYLEHENVVRFHSVCYATQYEMYLCMELCQYDLTKLLILRGITLTLKTKKIIISQLFEGLSYIHSKQIIHRDLKPDNILFSEDHVLKIADFGLAKRQFEDSSEKLVLHSPRLGTLWFKSFEVLCGKTAYSYEVDMWAAGCIMAQLWNLQPIFRGSCEMDQIKKIIENWGNVNLDELPNLKVCLPPHISFNYTHNPSFKDNLREILMGREAFDLLEQLLHYNVQVRITSSEARNHEFLTKLTEAEKARKLFEDLIRQKNQKQAPPAI